MAGMRQWGTGLVAAVLIAVLIAVLLPLSTSSATVQPSVPQTSATTPADSETRPLLIVLDTSGSMSEDDGTGTIKLAGAQAALSQVIRNQRPGSEIGLWAFPNDGGCGPGRSVIDVGPLKQREMIKKVNEVGASGDTPTGTALRAAVDSIKGEHDGATVLLISDGLHTCDPDPCEVAQEIRAEGFDLTVYPAGFQTSPEGLAELQCIANATGGEVYEADDAAGLIEVATAATSAELTVEVGGMPSRVPAGGARTVTVTVRNDTAQDVENARVQLNFANTSGTGPQIIPSVLPPRVDLGGLDAGDSTQRSWLVGFGTSGRTGTAGYRITAWGANAQPVSATGEVDVIDAVQTLDDAGGTIGTLKGKRIALLGDSYTAGEGAGDYEDGTQSKKNGGNGCHHSRNTYLAPLFQIKNLELLACSGATTHYIPGSDTESSNGVQEEQVPRLRDAQSERGPVEAVFMTVGGNDIGFKDVIIRCVAGHIRLRGPVPVGGLLPALQWDRRCADDADWTRMIHGRVSDLDEDLTRTYERVYDELNASAVVDKRDGRIAPVYVLAYPQPFPNAQWASWCPMFDSAEIDFANDLVDRLNAQIEGVVTKLRDEHRMRIHLVTTIQDAFLPDNTMCPRPRHEPFLNPVWDPRTLSGLVSQGEPYLKAFYDAAHFWRPSVAKDVILARNWGDPELLQERVHPSALGYQAETNALIAWSVGADEREPPGGWKRAEKESVLSRISGRLGDLLATPVSRPSGIGLDLQGGDFTADDLNVRAGQYIELTVTGGAPDSLTSLSVHSSARILANVRLDDEGAATVKVVMPRDLAPGPHHFEASGFNADGDPVAAAKAVDVARAFPPWLAPVLLGTLVALILGIWFLRRGLRTPARNSRIGSTASSQP